MSIERIRIKPSEIRFGDLIRWESDTSDTAREFRHTDPNSRHTAPGSYYLMDRPKPAVNLPTEIGHHLGWLTAPRSRVAGHVMGEWHFGDDGITASGFPEKIHRSEITAFTPATAVPTEALQEFRSWWMQANVGDIADTRIGDLLDAIEKAGDS